MTNTDYAEGREPNTTPEKGNAGKTFDRASLERMTAEGEALQREAHGRLDEFDAAHALVFEKFRQSNQALITALGRLATDTDPEIQQNARQVLSSVAPLMRDMSTNVANITIEMLTSPVECHRTILHMWETVSNAVASQVAEEVNPKMKETLEALSKQIDTSIATVKTKQREMDDRISAHKKTCAELQAFATQMTGE